MKFVPAFAVAGLTAAALVAPTAPAVAAAPTGKAEASSVSVQATKRASIKCTKPAGKKANYSWGTGSNDSTTVYFNNHCSHKVKAKLHFKAGGGQTTTKCMVTNGGTKGKKRFTVTRYHLKSITKGC